MPDENPNRKKPSWSFEKREVEWQRAEWKRSPLFSQVVKPNHLTWLDLMCTTLIESQIAVISLRQLNGVREPLGCGLFLSCNGLFLRSDPVLLLSLHACSNSGLCVYASCWAYNASSHSEERVPSFFSSRILLRRCMCTWSTRVVVLLGIFTAWNRVSRT